MTAPVQTSNCFEIEVAFSRDLRAGTCPDIESYLEGVEPPQRAELLRELIYLELTYRLEHGQHPTSHEYRQRYSEASDSIDQTLTQVNQDLRLPRGEKYRIVRPLGDGGFGRIYLAIDNLNRHVALKIPKEHWQEPATQRQFLSEARKAAKLDHPGIVRIYELNEPNDAEPDLFVAMEYIDGGTLADVAAAGVCAQRAAELMAQIAQAVHVAHERGLVHRDLKPQNVLMDRQGRPHVADFGLAVRLFHRSPENPALATAAADGSLMTANLLRGAGTPAYMSPEQWNPQDPSPDRRSDLWSLGVIFYELLCGQRPFTGSPEQIHQQVLGGQFTPPSRHRASVPSPLQRICHRCLAIDPKARYASAQELADDLRWWLQRKRRWHRRLLAAALSLAALAAVLTTWRWQEARKARAADAAVIARITEEGRQQLLSGHSAAAVERLQEAYARAAKRGAPSSTLRFLLARGLESLRQGSLRFGSPADPLSMPQVSATGTRLLAVDARQRLGIWDALGGQEFFRSTAHPQPVTGAFFSPDASLAAAVCGSEVFLWDAQAGQLRRRMSGHELDIIGAAFSPDSRYLATASADNTARIWNLSDGSAAVLRGHHRSVNLVRYSPGGERLLTASVDGELCLWDAASHQLVRKIKAASGRLGFAQFSPDSQLFCTVASLPASRVDLWKTLSGEAVSGLEKNWLSHPRFRADGSACLVAVGGADASNIEVWDVLSGQRHAKLVGHETMAASVDFSEDGALAVSGSFDKSVRVWDLASERELVRFEGSPGSLASSARFVAGGRILSSDDQQQWLLRSVSGGSLRQVWPLSILAHSSHHTLVQEAGGSVRLSPGLELDRGLPLEGVKASPAALSADGRLLAIGADASPQIHLWHLPAMQRQDIAVAESGVTPLCFDAPGARLIAASAFAGNQPRTLQVINIAQGRQLSRFRTRANLLGAGFDYAGRAVAILHESGLGTAASAALELRDLSSGSLLAHYPPPALMLLAATLSPDGTLLVVVDASGGAAVWHLPTGRPLPPISGHHSSFVNCAAFSPDAQFLATGGNDRSAKVWEVASGKLLVSFDAHAAAISRISWLQNGQVLAVTSANNQTRLWNAGFAPSTVVSSAIQSDYECN